MLVMLGLGACARAGDPPLSAEPDPPARAPGAALDPLADPVRAILPDDSQLARRSLPAAEASRPPAPLSLTASDGTGLRLVSLRARAVVEGPLAFTELHLEFDNPAARTIEGQFTIDLPEGSAISRFAMLIGGEWQEGEVVERQAARVAYEDFLHRKQDPALLENQAGNRFSARVFPIAAHARKSLIIAWSQALPDSRAAYRLPLSGLPALDHLELDVLAGQDAHADAQVTAVESVGQRRRYLVRRRGGAAPEDFTLRGTAGASVSGLRHGGLAVARVRAQGEVLAEPISALTILFDTSASRSLGYATAVRRLGALVARLGEQGTRSLQVIAFDQDAAVVFEGPPAQFGAPVLDRLYSRRALGASDLRRALRRVAARGPESRVLLVSDGIATAGGVELDGLQAAVRELGVAGVERIDALVDGGLQDRAVLQSLTTGVLEHRGVVLDSGDDAAALAQRLGAATLPDLTVTVPGADFSWPQTVRGAQPGDEFLVYADLAPAQAMRVLIEGDTAIEVAPELTEVERPLIQRALVGAQIEALTVQRSALDAADAAARARLEERIVGLSTKHRVLSDFTALLVLETEADYERFHLDRRALTDILQVGAHGVELGKRIPSRLPARDATPAPKSILPPDDGDLWGNLEGAEVGESYGLGGLGLVGTGRGGGGDGASTIGLSVVGSGDGGGSSRHRGEEGRMGRPSDDDDARPRVVPEVVRRQPPPAPPAPASSQGGPYEGRMAEIMALVDDGRDAEALRAAQRWLDEAPGDTLAIVALGESLERLGRLVEAARVYGSLIDLYPSRADMRRFVGNRLDRLADASAHELALDTYAQALRQRPDHPNSHRHLAWAYLRAERPDLAFETILGALSRSYPEERFRGVVRVLQEDAGLLAAALLRHDPEQADDIHARLREVGAKLATEPSLRFVMSWETDSNDVDFHIVDANGEEASFQSPRLVSGGELFADVTTGYGPECFAIPGAPNAFPYRFQAHYYARGPMGFGMGTLQIIEHDGRGGFGFDDRPFVIMRDRATVQLGHLAGPLGTR
ncbi:MAG: hypothetical protein IPH07_36990 [Deltaproteobacteria bacterium]|nr:hypothetical protein [Deltaproteobacteria bacterium]